MGFVATLEGAIAQALAEEGIEARGRSGEGIAWTGVWTGTDKIASIGLHVSQGVSKHGFAVNVDNDLAPFGWIVACGLPDVRMTSVTARARRRPAPAVLPQARRPSPGDGAWAAVSGSSRARGWRPRSPGRAAP